MPRPTLLLIALLLVLAACGGNQAATRDLVAEEATATSEPTVTPTPTPEPSITGTLLSWEDAPIAARKIVLCQKIENGRLFPADCILTGVTAISDDQGKFQYSEVPPGTYFIIYDSGYADFEAGVEQWSGQTLKLGDPEWLLYEFATRDADGNVGLLFPQVTSKPQAIFDVAYLASVLLIADSPFILAHDLEKQSVPVVPTVLEVSEDHVTHVEFGVYFVRPITIPSP